MIKNNCYVGDFNRQEWINKECVFTGSLTCDACPYVVYDEFGSRKCDKEMYDKCQSGEMYGDYEE